MYPYNEEHVQPGCWGRPSCASSGKAGLATCRYPFENYCCNRQGSQAVSAAISCDAGAIVCARGPTDACSEQISLTPRAREPAKRQSNGVLILSTREGVKRRSNALSKSVTWAIVIILVYHLIIHNKIIVVVVVSVHR